MGADLLLTAGHVIADIRAGTILPSDAGLRFDYREAYGGALTTSGTVFRLARSWLVASENAPAGGGLNYALLRVDGAPGVQPIGAARAESTARLRGWIEVPERPAVYPGTPVLIMGHPGGEPLRVSVGQLVGLSSDGAQLTYDNATTGGLSGAPCFNADLQLIGVHAPLSARRSTPSSPISTRRVSRTCCAPSLPE